MRKRMVYLLLLFGVALIGTAAWNVTARAAYESAEYMVVESDGQYEIREYPDLMLASTTTKVDAQGRDGSFMKLFRYISGANESQQKISMTTPVFMDSDNPGSDSRMGFVMPKEVTAEGVPAPTAERVSIRKRSGGRFAVLRFSGRMTTKLASESEKKLRAWIKAKGLAVNDASAASGVETAGYDPPFTPGPLRRNEVLIRLK